MAEHEWRSHDEITDAAPLVVVHVGTAHAHRGDLDEHLARRGLRYLPILDDDGPHVVEHRHPLFPTGLSPQGPLLTELFPNSLLRHNRTFPRDTPRTVSINLPVTACPVPMR